VVTGGDDTFPDGEYVWQIEKAFLTAVKHGDNQGQPQVSWWLRVVSGPDGTANRVYFHYHPLFGKDEDTLNKRITRIKTDLTRIEQTLADFRHLPGILQALADSKTEIRGVLKTGTAGIQNCYFNGLF
jgi:hypothetical protein